MMTLLSIGIKSYHHQYLAAEHSMATTRAKIESKLDNLKIHRKYVHVCVEDKKRNPSTSLNPRHYPSTAFERITPSENENQDILEFVDARTIRYCVNM